MGTARLGRDAFLARLDRIKSGPCLRAECVFGSISSWNRSRVSLLVPSGHHEAGSIDCPGAAIRLDSMEPHKWLYSLCPFCGSVEWRTDHVPRVLRLRAVF